MTIRGFLTLLLSVSLLFSCGKLPDNSGNNGNNENVPLLEGTLVGFVKFDDGTAASRVVVSDGYSCAITDEYGRYSINKNPDARFVFVSLPSNAKVPSSSTGLTTIYKQLRSAMKRYDFMLRKQEVEKKFRLVAVADPQPYNERHFNRLCDETITDLKAYLQELNQTDPLPTYGITLGDLVGNNYGLFPGIADVFGANSLGIAFFHTIGNHDHNKNATGDEDATLLYEEVFGPTNYSFNRGDVHFVVMDNINYTPSTRTFSNDLYDWQFEWLKQDLKYVAKDKRVVICMHIPMWSMQQPMRDNVVNLINNYKECAFMCGHTHTNVNSKNIYGNARLFQIGTACGGDVWKSNLCCDASPNGYAIHEIDGNKLVNEYYKGTFLSKDYQIRMYRASDFPSSANLVSGEDGKPYAFPVTGDNVIWANIWNSNDDWKIEVYENDVLSGSMTRLDAPDMWAKAYFINYCKQSSGFGNTYHMFYYKLKNADSKVKIVAKDAYGNTYQQSKFTTCAESDYPLYPHERTAN